MNQKFIKPQYIHTYIFVLKKALLILNFNEAKSQSSIKLVPHTLSIVL